MEKKCYATKGRYSLKDGKTMKVKALEFIAKNKRVPRQELVKFIIKENGSRSTSDGYYSTNLQEWERQGLVKRINGIFSVTALGKRYIKNPSIIREVNLTRRLRNACKSYDYQAKRGYNLYENLLKLEKLMANLNWDFDRMSQSGQLTLRKIDGMMAKSIEEYMWFKK